MTEVLLRPIERFLRIEAAGGIVLLGAAVLALAWANSPWHGVYEALWHTEFAVSIGSFEISRDLHFLINDGLMTIFFLVVGLEIRREIHEGELSDLRRAALPLVAALGGMAFPALIYLSLNRTPELRHGWAIPTATDIAFAVGVLALLGSRVLPALRVLLLALAIIDDIGAIVVIALFYSAGISVVGLCIAILGAAGILLFQRFEVRRALPYVLPAGVLWYGVLKAGVHPTIAGVIVGLLTPVRSWFGSEGFIVAAADAIEVFRERSVQGGSHDLLQPLRRIRQADREALPPVVRLQALLHPWVAYGIMPIFAFANAGVRVGELDRSSSGSETVIAGILLGLVVGKPLGILSASAVSVKLGICRLPSGVKWSGVLLVGAVAGIGFTMAIFITGLAFPESALSGVAKLAILLSSFAAALIGLIVGKLVLPRALPFDVAQTCAEAEASTEQ